MAETVKNEPRTRDDSPTPSTPGLVVVHSAATPHFQVLPLRRGRLALGRDELAALHIHDDRVSHRHLEVEHDGTAWTIRDCESTNGTFVDGDPLTRPRHESPRLIRIGRTLLLPTLEASAFAKHGLSVRDGRVVGPGLRRAHEQIARTARAGQGLLLTGNSGAGKEVAARVYHEASAGKRGGVHPFVALNCATVQPELAERILFGARRGAYSGSVADAEGLIQSADGGTLFLDEIAELATSVQAKLLRVLETHEVTRIGGLKPEPVDFRLISATHRDLRAEVVAGRFREDLYFRVGRPELRLAPLSERREEIPWLVQLAIRSVAESAREASVELVEACLLRPWPGNVRELLAEIRAATLQAGERITVLDTDLSEQAGRDLAPVQRPAPAPDDDDPIAAALAAEDGNASRAAARLGISRGKVRRFIERQGKRPGTQD